MTHSRNTSSSLMDAVYGNGQGAGEQGADADSSDDDDFFRVSGSAKGRGKGAGSGGGGSARYDSAESTDSELSDSEDERRLQGLGGSAFGSDLDDVEDLEGKPEKARARK